MEIQDMETAGRLARLSGMAYAQGDYTPQEWQEKTGVNCAEFPGYIIITASGKTQWTKAAEAIYRAQAARHHNNMKALGLR